MLRPTHSAPRRSLTTLGLAAAVSAGAVFAPTAANAADGQKVLGAAALKTVKPSIVGGNQIQVANAPWQVAVLGNSGTLCGGSIVDATHIVSAAHCFYDQTNTLVAANQYQILAGASNLQAPEPGDDPQQIQAAAVAIHPGYVSPGGSGTLDQFANDVAVITLATPLDLGRPTAASRPIALPGGGANPAAGSSAFVSGFGLQAQGAPTPDGNLYGLTTAVLDGSATNDGSGPLNAIFVTTQSANGSFCQGDSGGGLVQTGTLVGIVSNNGGCGAGEAVQYTSVSAQENLTFIQNAINGTATPIPLAPRGGTDVTLSYPLSMRSGDTLTCNPGTWTNAPTYTYAFTDTRNGTVLANGTSATYTLTNADAGRTISCRATATTAGGVALSPPTGATPAAVAGPTPTPSPTPRPTPSPTPAPTPSAARLSASLSVGRTRVAQGSTVAFRITVRNSGDNDASNVRTCIRINSRFSLTSRGGATFSGGRLCWRNSSLNASTTKRFTLRADRDARVGRVSQSVSVTATSVRTATASRALTIVRRAAAPRPGGVTG